jgi:hypothetical protein
MWIMVVGPYTAGAADAATRAENLRILNHVAVFAFSIRVCPGDRREHGAADDPGRWRQPSRLQRDHDAAVPGSGRRLPSGRWSLERR